MLGENIRRARSVKGISQRRLSELIGKKPATVCNYEKGLVTPPADVLQDIANVLETTIDNITNGNSHEKDKDLLMMIERQQEQISHLQETIMKLQEFIAELIKRVPMTN